MRRAAPGACPETSTANSSARQPSRPHATDSFPSPRSPRPRVPMPTCGTSSASREETPRQRDRPTSLPRLRSPPPASRPPPADSGKPTRRRRRAGAATVPSPATPRPQGPAVPHARDPRFIRQAGIRHSRASSAISPHLASRASDGRAAVRIWNRRQVFADSVARHVSIRCIAAGASTYGTLRMCWRTAGWGTSAPATAATGSTSINPAARACRKRAPSAVRSLRPVPGCEVHTRSRARSTSGLPTRSTGRSSRSAACRSSVAARALRSLRSAMVRPGTSTSRCEGLTSRPSGSGLSLDRASKRKSSSPAVDPVDGTPLAPCLPKVEISSRDNDRPQGVRSPSPAAE